MSSKEAKIALDANSLHASLEALDCVRKAFEEVSGKENLTKKDLADLVGKDPSYVSRILNGRVSNVNYLTLSRFLIAMGYWPTLERTPIGEIPSLANYCHRDQHSGDYSTASLPIWQKYLNNGDSDSGTGNISTSQEAL